MSSGLGSSTVGGDYRTEVLPKRGLGLADRVVGLEIYLLVLHRFPQPLDKHVVAPGDLAVHADADILALEQSGERLIRKLAALVGVEDVGCTVAMDGFLDRLDAEVGLHRDGHTPRQHPTGVPVDHGREVHVSARHRDVGDVHGPNLVGAGDD